MNKWFKSGSPWIWLSAGGVSLSLISVLGLLWLIASRGLSYFWPAQVHQFELLDKHGQASTVIGEIYDRESIPSHQLAHLKLNLDPEQETVERLLIKTGNRELVSLDFRWILVPEITKQSTPEKLVVVERRTNGNFYGYINDVVLDGKSVPQEELPTLLDRVLDIQYEIEELQKVEIGAINYQLERLRLRERKYKLENKLTPENAGKIESEVATLESEYQVLEKTLLALRDKTSRDQLKMRAMDGQIVTVSFEDILKVTTNNKMNTFEKLMMFFSQIASFVSDDPREANTEGGVFPAIFGTV
ncbi:MAG: phosphate ABC transporter, permease protein PstA, partial [Thalassotalea sp.]|nr:phosphate ABC transporter, permease protein PstA [Thalassotalea sp.]